MHSTANRASAIHGPGVASAWRARLFDEHPYRCRDHQQADRQARVHADACEQATASTHHAMDRRSTARQSSQGNPAQNGVSAMLCFSSGVHQA